MGVREAHGGFVRTREEHVTSPPELSAHFKPALTRPLLTPRFNHVCAGSFGSLHQPPRAAEELFRLGLKAATDVWCGHAHTTCWIQTRVPPNFSGVSYDQSGWVTQQGLKPWSPHKSLRSEKPALLA